jgi:uncharacterized iron-regulated membrane protein
MLIRYTNVHDRRWPLHVPTAVCLAVAILGGAICWRARREVQKARGEPNGDGEETAREAVGTLALWGLALAAYFLLLILAQAYPAFVLSPREIT